MRSLTAKQTEILTLVVKANPDGSFLDIDQLREGLGKTVTYAMSPPSKDALQFSIRYMIGHGLIEKRDCTLRRSAHRRVIAVTMMGLTEYRDLLKV